MSKWGKLLFCGLQEHFAKMSKNCCVAEFKQPCESDKIKKIAILPSLKFSSK